MTYIRQTGGSTCALISALNARTFYDLDVKKMREGESGFKRLAKKYHCLNGCCLNVEEMWSELGLGFTYQLDPKEKWVRAILKSGWCVQLTISTPNTNLHAVLLVGCRGKLFEVVNSQLYGPHDIELLSWKDLCMEPARKQRQKWENTCVVFHKL